MLGRRHTVAEYAAVALITLGVALFSLKPGTIGEAFGSKGVEDGENRLIGLSLVRSPSVRKMLRGLHCGRTLHRAPDIPTVKLQTVQLLRQQ